MAKKKPARGKSPASLRRKLESIDRQMVKLANERAKLGQDLAVKTQNEDVEETPGVDTDLLEHIGELNKGPLSDECLQAMFRELESGSRALLKPLRVAFLGPSYSYSHLAAIKQFGESVELVPVGTIGAVFEEVNRGHADYGVVPLENSTDGRVADTLDMFTRLSTRICGEVPLSIHHYLLAKCPRAEVREVYSRPQALSQCRNWLARHLSGVRTIEVTSTSTAAQLASEKQGAAAIASREAGVHYGLEVLAERIEDNQANVTRFAVISGDSAPRTGKDKTAIMFEIKHKPGALADATAIFKRNKLNMTWIESFPIARPEGGYLFFVEFDGHERDAKVKKALVSLEKLTLRFEVLGSYPLGEVLED